MGTHNRENPHPSWKDGSVPDIKGTAVFEWNITDNTLWYSDEWRHIVQSDDYDWTNSSNEAWWADHIHPDDRAILERSALGIATGFANATESLFRFKRGDGSWRWLLTRSQVVERSLDGTATRVCGICLDLTDSYAGSGKSRGNSSISDFDYHAMFENSPDLFIRVNREFKPIYINPVASRYLKQAELEHVLTCTDNIIKISGFYTSIVQKNIEQVFHEKVVSREPLSFIMPDGREIFGESSFWPEYDAMGNVQYAIVHFRDLTEKHKMEQRILLNEQRLSALYNLTCMDSASEDEVLNFVMDSVLKLSDSKSGFMFFPEDNALGQGHMFWSKDHYQLTDKDCVPDNAMPPDILQQVFTGDSKNSYRHIYNGDGVTPLWIIFDRTMPVMRVIITPVMEDERIVCISGVCNKDFDYDESDLQQLETFINSAWLILRRRRFVHALEAAKETAETANKAKNAFLANVSHELRTPLNGVLSMLQLIESMSMGEQQRTYLRTAQSSGKALLRIISDLLDFSCMESGNMPLNAQIFDCKAAILSSLNLFEDDAARRGLHFRHHIDPAIPEYLMGDENRISQIIFNVVGNALKFTVRGGIEVFCEIKPGAPAGKVCLGITVTDTGIGIPEDKLSSIFDAFIQIESSNRTGKYSGTGLGLGIVKHLISRMDGTISVESELGKGTCFRCSFLLALPADGQCPAENHNSELFEAPQIQSLDILLAEDDAVSAFALRTFLERKGHRVLCVTDGAQALGALQLHDFDCLFTDIAMPRMDGTELIRRIRANALEEFPPSQETEDRIRAAFAKDSRSQRTARSDIPVVAVTAHTMIGDRERFLAQGVDHYISKPIMRDELYTVLRQLTQNR